MKSIILIALLASQVSFARTPYGCDDQGVNLTYLKTEFFPQGFDLNVRYRAATVFDGAIPTNPFSSSPKLGQILANTIAVVKDNQTLHRFEYNSKESKWCHTRQVISYSTKEETKCYRVTAEMVIREKSNRLGRVILYPNGEMTVQSRKQAAWAEDIKVRFSVKKLVSRLGGEKETLSVKTESKSGNYPTKFSFKQTFTDLTKKPEAAIYTPEHSELEMAYQPYSYLKEIYCEKPKPVL